MNELEQLKELLLRHEPRNADAIVLLAGDRYHRVSKAAELYHAGHAPFIVVTSSADDWDYGSLPSSKLLPKLLELGVREEHIISEETAGHTREEAESTLKIARERDWKTLLLVTTGYHQYRAFLTWVKALHDMGLDIALVIVPVLEFPEFKEETEEDALERELERIRVYQEKGDVADWALGIAYLQRIK